MATILNALQLKNGAKVTKNHLGTLTQPVQFLPEKLKDDVWRSEVIDWIEIQGMKQLKRKARRLMKNYKLAKGIIDKTDYIVEEDNDQAELIDYLTKEDESAFELKFYPIIPTVVDVLCNEFCKRTSKLVFTAIDDGSVKEKEEEKRGLIEQTLLADFRKKQLLRMIELGLDPESEEGQQSLSDESIKSLPEIEQFFRKDYRSIYEEWATHQYNADMETFRMQELEERGFRDMLITDSEFWHLRMMENDYEVELWNPPQVFYSKSPGARYISESNWVGMSDLLTVADVIDKYGWMMDQEQLESLERIHPVQAAAYNFPMQNDGSFYDASKSHSWNTQMPSLAYRQFMSAYDAARGNGDIVDWILSDSEDLMDWGNQWLLRTTTIYWKTQRKIYHLTKIDEEGIPKQSFVSEDYKVTDKPLYDTTIYKNKSKDNLLFGEHMECLWLNEVWGGIKIGPNRPTLWNEGNDSISPIYLGINGGKPGRLPYQFRGEHTLYGCKPPVEGAVFSDRNTKSYSLVDKMKPFQIGYNMVNNQIADILVDELGTVILFDQNALPRHSMGEDWGKGDLGKAYVAMKNFQMFPVDHSMGNMEGPNGFNQYTVLNMEQSQRMLTRIQLASYFKQEAFGAIGLTPQRMGQQLSQIESAKGLEQAVSLSYSQTESYFTQHSDNLMPRVHQMRTELARYYHSTNPSVRLQYLSTADERITFNIDGTRLLLRDFNVHCTTKTNSRSIMDQLKQLALNNNTSNATIFDLGNIIKADSVAEIDQVLKATDEKMEAQRREQMEHEQQMHQEELAAAERQRQMDLQFEAEQNDKDRQANILIAEIRGAGMGAAVDLDENNQSDFQDAMKTIQQQQQYQDTMSFKREQEVNKNSLEQQKMQLKREEMRSNQAIARENKTAAELQAAGKLKQQKQAKKK